MTCLITGAAGFIGSHLSRLLLTAGWKVRGVDNFADFYPRRVKERNIADLKRNRNFEFIEQDLVRADLSPLLEGVSAVAHLAAQAGVRTSWGVEFRTYTDANILATQRLLEACRKRVPEKFVFASSSSVYGETQHFPVPEEAPLVPLSPYGVTKLAAEHLCRLYWKSFGVPTVCLRYFTVYGPGQRPDMSFHRFIRAALSGEPLTLFGTGEQTRDFTFVGDAVEATAAALQHGQPGGIYNIGGGNRISLKEVIGLLPELTGSEPRIEHLDFVKGDMMHTAADTGRARRELQFSPRTGIEEGLEAEVLWLRRELR